MDYKTDLGTLRIVSSKGAVSILTGPQDALDELAAVLDDAGYVWNAEANASEHPDS